MESLTDTSGARNDGSRDLQRAIAELADRLPGPIKALARVAYNYRWSWLPGGAALFRDMDPGCWSRSHGNPRWLIEALQPCRLRQLASDPSFVARAAAVAARIDADLRRPPEPQTVLLPDLPIAYFSSEFGAHCSLPLYGGGLGVLAGDVLKAASDLALPMVGIGLLYHQGYFQQRLDLSGWQQEYWTPTDFNRLPIVLVRGRDCRPISVELEICDRTVFLQVWRADFGRVPLYLLDSDRPDNHPIDRWITARLYTSDRHIRLAQYGLLGVGGLRALHALGIRPGLVHLNEGHAALAGLERMGLCLAQGLSFDDALASVRREFVFTTHTPVAAGNEWYSREDVEPVLGRLASSLGISRTILYGLGRLDPWDETEQVNITPLALRLSRAANAVSRRHGEVARDMWQRLWPGRAPSDVPIGHVTNGVHTGTWMAEAMQRLLDRYLPPGWRERTWDPDLWLAIGDVPEAELWGVRQQLRAMLVEIVREKSVRDRLARGEAGDYVQAAARAFDPEVLTIGFARRVATYKRLNLLTRQFDRALALLADQSKPIQVVIAGKAHPADIEAKEALRSLLESRRAPHVGSRITFLENYDLHLAPAIISGVDLWLNLPRPPLEASGTSGMKVVLNGGLNLSVLDGWWAEAYDGESGWAIASPDGDAWWQDDRDATTLYDLLTGEVIPLFYERDASGIPQRWLGRVKTAMSRLIPRFTAQRMLRDYVATMYTPSGETVAAPGRLNGGARAETSPAPLEEAAAAAG